MKVKITKLLHQEIDIKKGPNKGNKVTQVRIWTDKHDDKMLSAFMVKGMEAWKVGDQIEIEVEQKGEYLNFKLPDKAKEDLKKICDYMRKLEKRVLKLEQQLGIDEVKQAFGGEEISEENAPF